MLEALANQPFEPLAKASLMDLTIKTSFLVALANLCIIVDKRGQGVVPGEGT